MITQDQLAPGDGIIYTGSNLFDGIEKVKLGSDATHFEVYIGNGKVVTSLMKTGVGIYDQCKDEILMVIRPIVPFFVDDALDEFKNMIGMPYGTKGLLNFTDQNVFDDGLFCSQVGCTFYRLGKMEPFNHTVLTRRVSPMHFLYVSSNVFDIVYLRP